MSPRRVPSTAAEGRWIGNVGGQRAAAETASRAYRRV